MKGAVRLLASAAALAASVASAGPVAVLLMDGEAPPSTDIGAGELRVTVAVPSPGATDGRSKQRREKITAAVQAFVDGENAGLPPGADTLHYFFMSEDHAEFAKAFPLHSSATPEEDRLPFPGIRLSNLRNGDYMMPDWHITLGEFPEELTRLVKDFRRWVKQDTTVVPDADGVLKLHTVNMKAALEDYDRLLVNFYAPWCKFSQAMLPRVAQASRWVQEMASAGLFDVTVGLGQVNLDEETVLKSRHKISSYPTLKVVKPSADLDEHETSVVFAGGTETPSQILSHLVSTLEPFRELESAEDAGRLAALLGKVDEAFQADNSPERAVLVLATFVSPTTVDTMSRLAELISGKGVFVALTDELEAAEVLVQARCAALGVSPPAGGLAVNSVFVVSAHGALAAPPLALVDLGVSPQTAGTLVNWVSAACFPLVDRFDPSSAQGDRVRSGPITTVMVLVADEDDFMFGDFMAALEATAETHRGQAVFLFADDEEPRIAPLLRNAKVTALPAVVAMSMQGAFPMIAVSAREITPEGLSGIFANIDAHLEEAATKDEL